MTKYNIYNPTAARRVIHPCVAGSRPVEILPRKSVDGVELADHVAKDLLARAQENRDTELQLAVVQDEAPVDRMPAMKMTVNEDGVAIVKAKR